MGDRVRDPYEKISGIDQAPGTGWPMPLILHFGGSVATHADKIGFPKGTPLAHDFACKV